MTARRVNRFGEDDWHVPLASGSDPAQGEAAGERGARRAFLAQGDAGFCAQVVCMPPQFEAPLHAHDYAEVFMLLDRGCTFDGQPIERFDCTVIEADQTYEFTAGPDGLTFLVVRTSEAAYSGTGS